MSEELKLCPFCGSEAELHKHDPDFGGSVIGCTSCEFVGMYFETDQDAITAWNTRTPDNAALVRKLVEALKNAKEALYRWPDIDDMTEDEVEQYEGDLEEIDAAIDAAKEAGYGQ